MEQTLIDSINPVQMDLTIDEITQTNPVEMDTGIDGIETSNPVEMDTGIDGIETSNPVEMDTSIDGIQTTNPSIQVQIDLSISEIEPNLAEMDLSLSIDQPKIEMEAEIAELISKIKEETILNIIEQCKILFEKNKSCENYNNILKVFNKTIKNRGYFDDDKVYSFQQFHISKYNIIKENEKKAHIMFMMKNTVHRQAIYMTIPESMEIAPELQTELSLIQKFMEDNIEYI